MQLDFDDNSSLSIERILDEDLDNLDVLSRVVSHKLGEGTLLQNLSYVWGKELGAEGLGTV